MKIAVCLSGQPRTIKYAVPSILNFFSEGYEYDFFCHAWNYNTYKRRNDNALPGVQPVYWDNDEIVENDELTESISLLHPKKFAIHGKNRLNINENFPWYSLFYSVMYANHLKKQFEIENNFRYDFVIRTRFDLIYFPLRKFKLTTLANKDNYLDIFCLHTNRIDYEYNRINSSDTFYYGSSLAMDIASDIYRYLFYKSKIRRLDDNECLGPGANLSNFADTNNLRFNPLHGEIFESVFRPEVTHLDPLTDFETIKDFNDSFYFIKKAHD